MAFLPWSRRKQYTSLKTFRSTFRILQAILGDYLSINVSHEILTISWAPGWLSKVIFKLRYARWFFRHNAVAYLTHYSVNLIFIFTGKPKTHMTHFIAMVENQTQIMSEVCLWLETCLRIQPSYSQAGWAWTYCYTFLCLRFPHLIQVGRDTYIEENHPN